MSLTKSHEALSDKQVKNAVARMGDYRFATRNRAIISLGLYAGLRACEIGAVCWKDVLTADDAIGDELRVRNLIAKGKHGGGLVAMNGKLKSVLSELFAIATQQDKPMMEIRNQTIIRSQNNRAMKTQSIVNLMFAHYRKCDIQASSHTARKTFITNTARLISTVGGSIHDIAALARHSSIQTTQIYLSKNSDAQKIVVNMI